MWQYIGKRVVSSILTLWALITVTFFLTRCMPGNPFQTENVSPQILETMEEEYGLNQPLFSQYMTYLSHLLQGDLGVSYRKQGVQVMEVIHRALPTTLLLGSAALVLSLTMGVLIGILQGVNRRYRWLGYLCAALEGIGTGIPNFVIALILLLLFGVQWRLLPTVGMTSVWHMILPVVSLSIYPMMQIARYTYGQVSIQLHQEYVVFAHMKGLGMGTIVFRHILRNCIPQIIHFTSPMIAFLLTGSFVVESIYTIPGLGREFVNAIGNRDYTMIMGLTIFMGCIVLLVQLLLDIICAWIDPRVRMSIQE